jgi:hypothetical protein
MSAQRDFTPIGFEGVVELPDTAVSFCLSPDLDDESVVGDFEGAAEDAGVVANPEEGVEVEAECNGTEAGVGAGAGLRAGVAA